MAIRPALRCAAATAPDTFLAERANRIRQLGRKVVADVVEIGRVLIECRERLNHGAWLEWLENEFAWSDQTARNFMRVAELAANSKHVLDLDLPLRDLYLLAAPSTPETARQEVFERAAAGERLHHNDVAAILRAAKQFRAERAEVRRAERIERIAEICKGNTPLPISRRYPVLLADVPWRFKSLCGDEPSDRAPDYPTMEIDELCALPVVEIAADPAILFFWTTSPFLELAFEVINAWGFKYSTSAVWDKSGTFPGLGHIFRIDHELLLIARRGHFPSPPPNTRPSSVITAPRHRHSRKPDKVYECIERMYPTLPRFELFARQPRPGWAAWGNQVGRLEAAE